MIFHKQIMKIALLVAAIIAVSTAQTIHNSLDTLLSGSSGGGGCRHTDSYVLRVSVAENIWVAFPTANLNAGAITSAQFVISPTSCKRGDKITVYVYSTEPGFKMTETDCSFFTENQLITTSRLDTSCGFATPVDVTSAVKAAILAGNDQVVLTLSAGIDDDVDFNSCQLQSNGSIGCGVFLNGHSSSQSSFSLVINGGSSSSAAPSTSQATSTAALTTAQPTTVAPSTAAPTSTPSSTAAQTTPAPQGSTTAPTSHSPTTARPTTIAPSTTALTNAPSTTAVQTTAPQQSTTAAPTTTAAPANDISGHNNARNNSSKNLFSVKLLAVFLAAVLLLL
jgi:hypothetical protein